MGLVHDHPHTWPAPLQPLEHAEFRLLWLGTLVSNAGSWMQRVATAWLVFSMTGSTAWLGAESFVAAMPTVLLLPFGGVIADQLDRRKLLIAAYTLNAGVATALALGWWAGVLRVWHILGASFCSGLIASVMVPASQSVMPTIAGEDHIPGAVALNSVQYNVARGVGPALGGVALTWGGPGWCFLLNSLSFLALGAVFVVIRTVPQPGAAGRRVLGELRAGFRYVGKHRDVRLLLAIVAILALGGAPAVSMLPALATVVLLRHASAFAVLVSAFGIGAACAGIAATFQPALQRTPRLVWGAMATVGLAHMGLAWHEPLWLATGLVGLAGAAFVGAMIELGTELLQQTPDMFRGRVSSIQQIMFRTGQPVGSLLAGVVAERAGLGATFALFGGSLVLVTIILAAGHLGRRGQTRSG
jgi:predicted MFS family arabinose efflux permease